MLIAILTLAGVFTLAGAAYLLHRREMTPWALAALAGAFIGAGFWTVTYGPTIVDAVWHAITFMSYVLWTVFKWLAFAIGCATMLWGLRRWWLRQGGTLPRMSRSSNRRTVSSQDSQRTCYTAEILPSPRHRE